MISLIETKRNMHLPIAEREKREREREMNRFEYFSIRDWNGWIVLNYPFENAERYGGADARLIDARR